MLRVISWVMGCGMLAAPAAAEWAGASEWRETIVLAQQQVRDGQLEAAREALIKALELARAGGADPASEACTLNNLADVMDEMGRFREAERHYKRSIALWESVGQEGRDGLSRPVNNLAVLYSHMGRSTDAKRLYERALAIRTELKGAGHAELGPVLSSLCLAEVAMRRFADAEAHCRQAAGILENAGGEGLPTLAHAYMNMALLHRAKGDVTTAAGWSEKAMSAAEHTAGVRRSSLIQILTTAGEIEMELGLRAKAGETLERARSVAEECLTEDHPLFADILFLQARLLRQGNRKGEARKLEARAEKIASRHRVENLLDYSVDVSDFRPR